MQIQMQIQIQILKGHHECGDVGHVPLGKILLVIGQTCLVLLAMLISISCRQSASNKVRIHKIRFSEFPQNQRLKEFTNHQNQSQIPIQILNLTKIDERRQFGNLPGNIKIITLL